MKKYSMKKYERGLTMRLTIEPAKDIPKEHAVTDILRRRLSSGVFLCNKVKLGKHELMQFGISTPYMIIDRSKGLPCISYIPVRDVFSVKVIKSDRHGFIVEIPSQKEVHQEYVKRHSNLLIQAENILLGNIGQYLAKIGRVQNGLNPFKEILLSLSHTQEIPLLDLYSRYPRKKKERMHKYLNFLADLDYIVQEENRIVPGDELIKFEVVRTKTGGKDLTEEILGDLITRGREYITKHLSIFMLEPYLSLASTVYLHSYLAGKEIRMTVKDVHNYIRNTYPNIQIKAHYHLNSYLQEMTGVGIIESDNQYYMGREDIFNKFKKGLAQVTAL
jgi:hypothetical protein